MSNMLDQAIVDAQSLREAAIKSAEKAVVEKYAPEVKQAVQKLLEQEPGEEDIVNCRVFIHHPDKYTKEEIWDKKIKPVWEPIKRTLIDSKYNIDLFELDMYTEDES